MKWLCIFPAFLLFIGGTAVAQKSLEVRDTDTLHVPKGFQVILHDTAFVAETDTLIILHGERGRVRENPYDKAEQFYDSLEERAGKRRVTRELHDLLVRKQRTEPRIDSAIFKSEDSFKPYAGYRIRNISVKRVHLLEGSVVDTSQTSTTKVAKLVNRLHTDTREFIIRNNLLFKTGEPVDPYRLADNERLLRQFKTIRDARIYLKPVPGEPGMVDVVVVTQDVAAVGASGAYSSLNDFSLQVYNINILGFAKQLQISYFRKASGAPVDGYEITLREQNIGHSFIQGELTYTDNYLRNRLMLSAGRDFLTPSMKYAGGLELFRTKENYVINRNDTVATPYTQESADVWAARAYQVSNRTNLIFALRNNTFRFPERPIISADSNQFFFRRNLLLGGVTLIKTNYFKGSLISGFGKTEDVPVNTWAGINFGREHNEFSVREYAEFKAGIGRYFPEFGYFSSDFAVGGFHNHSAIEDGVIRLNAFYFSNLLQIRQTRIRQFIRFDHTDGFNRTVVRTIGIPGAWRDPGGFVPLGNQRTSIGIETIYFTPWYLYGFKFALYHGADLHLLKINDGGSIDQLFFTSLRAGIRTLNDNLVLPTISLDFRYRLRAETYKPSFSVSVSTTLPRLFGTSVRFKPEPATFN